MHLLQHIETPDRDVAAILRDVARGVRNDTKNSSIPQVPWINCSLIDHNIVLHHSSESGNYKNINRKQSESLYENTSTMASFLSSTSN